MTPTTMSTTSTATWWEGVVDSDWRGTLWADAAYTLVYDQRDTTGLHYELDRLFSATA